MELTKKDVVVVALGSLQGASGAVDTEDVAIAAHALAPVAFGWRKHTSHIDLDVVRMSLRHEKESPEGRIVGSVRTGWNLTPAGQRWLAERADLTAAASLTVADTPTATTKKRLETRDHGSAVSRVLASSAYKAWVAGEPVTPRAAAHVFRIDEYTPARDRQLKTARIHDLVSAHGDLAVFLEVAIPAALALRGPAPALTPSDD